MKKIIYLLFLFLISCKAIYAQNNLSVVIKDSLTKEPLLGAIIIEKGTNNAASTDISGKAFLNISGSGKINFTCKYIGYKTKNLEIDLSDEKEVFTILLAAEINETNEITIMSTRTNSRIEDAPVKIEVLGLEEMNEENSIKPGNVSSILGDISSIQIQQISPVTGSSVVRMQGLDGKYTLLLRDGIPSYNGLSGGLNILQIPPLDLKQIEIIKGPSSTINGAGAIAGMINFISKEPSDSGDAAFTINQSTLKETNFNAYLSKQKNKIGFTTLGAYTTQQAVDVDKDGYSDVAELQSFLIHPQFFYSFNKRSKIKIGMLSSMEDRSGGDMMAIKNNIDTLHQYFNNIRSVQNAIDIRFDYYFENENRLSFKSSANNFSRKENTKYSEFNADQFSIYSELFYLIQKNNHQFIFGTNYLLDTFHNNISTDPYLQNYHNFTTGFFSQYNLNIEKKLNLQAGIRSDYHSEYGWFILSSLAAFIHVGNNFSIRGTAGTGYKTPDPVEILKNESVNDSVDVRLTDNIKAEQSTGGTAEWNYNKIFANDISLFINQTFFYTEIKIAIITNATANNNTYEYVNTNGKVNSKGIDNYIRIMKHPYEVYLGYTYTLPEKSFGDHKFLSYTPLHRAAFTFVDALTEQWRIGIETSYNGYQYKDDGSKTRDYFFVAASIQYKTGAFTFVLNGENLLDFRQTKYERVVSGNADHPVFSKLWAPVDGRVINFSVMMKIP